MSGQHTWPDTLDIMGWRIDQEGFGVIFDRAIPKRPRSFRRSTRAWILIAALTTGALLCVPFAKASPPQNAVSSLTSEQISSRRKIGPPQDWRECELLPSLIRLK